MTGAARALEAQLKEEIGTLLFGADDVIHALVIALIGRGHVLLEGPPGTGKTSLSKTFAQVLGGRFKRIQGTSDLMPSDITGVHIFNSETRKFEFEQGPLFADVVLVDEVNRAGPKTQSALLEAMEERQVSVDRDTFALPAEFMVVATQNPREFEGTFPLPESQLDRFALCVPVQYPEREEEARVLQTYSRPDSRSTVETNLQVVADGSLDQAREELAGVHLSEELIAYALDIATATRGSGRINLGLSTRGALALARCARIEAALRGGEFVVPDDVQRVAPWVVPHRVVLTADAVIDGLSARAVVAEILDNVPVPR